MSLVFYGNYTLLEMIGWRVDPPSIEPIQGVLNPLAHFTDPSLIFWVPWSFRSHAY
jgi:hypothetical protein